MEPSVGLLAAMGRYRAAVQAVGQSASVLLIHVCLDNRSLTEWAEPRGFSVSVVTGRLLAAMDRLAEHYGVTLDDLKRVEV